MGSLCGCFGVLEFHSSIPYELDLQDFCLCLLVKPGGVLVSAYGFTQHPDKVTVGADTCAGMWRLKARTNLMLQYKVRVQGQCFGRRPWLQKTQRMAKGASVLLANGRDMPKIGKPSAFFKTLTALDLSFVSGVCLLVEPHRLNLRVAACSFRIASNLPEEVRARWFGMHIVPSIGASMPRPGEKTHELDSRDQRFACDESRLICCAGWPQRSDLGF